MTEEEFIDMVCQGNRNNQELEDKEKYDLLKEVLGNENI